MTDFDPRSYWENRLRTQWGLHGVGYLGLGGPFNEWMYRIRRRVFRRLATRIAAEAGLDLRRARVLDAGSGTGFYLQQWLDLGVTDLAGSDLTVAAVEQLRERFPTVRLEVMDIADPVTAFEPGAYDIVSIFDVLFHIVDDARYRAAFRNLASLLRPGGVLLLSENFLHGPAVRTRHVVSRSAAEIAEIARQAGLSPIGRGPMFVLMNYPVDASRMAQGVWTVATRPFVAHRSIRWIYGQVAGAVLTPLELLLTSTLREGPSTEWAAYRRSADP